MTDALNRELLTFLHFETSASAMQFEQFGLAPDPANVLVHHSARAVGASLLGSFEKERYGFYLSLTAASRKDPARYIRYRAVPVDGPYHLHQNYELTYVAQGRFTYVMNGAEVTLRQGEAMLMNPNCVHFDRNRAEDATVVFLSLQCPLFEEFALGANRQSVFRALCRSSAAGSQQYLIFRPEDDEGRALLEDRLAACMAEGSSGLWRSQEVTEILALRVFLLLESRFACAQFSVTGKLQKDMVFIQIDRYIREHLRTVTTQELVRVFHFNDKYFYRKIRQKYGMTLTEYILRRRIERARQLLMSSDLSAGEIMEQIGYRNSSYFFRIFRQQTGMTPIDYRNSLRGVIRPDRIPARDEDNKDNTENGAVG